MPLSESRTLPRDLRVLIIGINYWPEETGNAPYTTGLAEHLAATGRRVSVLTAMPYYPFWQVHEGYGRRLRKCERINGVEVRRFRNYIPRRQSAARRLLFEGTFFSHALTGMGIERPDVVIGVVPSLSGAGLAAVMARRFRIPFGLIIQDLVGSAAVQSGMPGGKRVAGATRGIEGWCARRAAGVAVVSEGFRPYLIERGVEPDRIVHLRNWSHIQPPSRPRQDIRHELGWDPNRTIVLHAGAMGLKQGLENVVFAAQRAANAKLNVHFVLMGDGSQRPALMEQGRGCPNLHFLDPRPAEDFPNVLAAADVLLINERASLVDMALPSKLTSYLVAGRPVVAAVSPEGWTAREVHRSGAGITVPAEAPDDLVAALADLSADPARGEHLGAAGPRYVAEYLTPAAALANAEAFIAGLLVGSEVPTTAAPEGALGS